MSANSSGGRRGRGGGGPQARGNRGGRGGRGGADGRGRGGTPPIDRTGVPRGICSFYWSTGACDRSFDCTFKHEVKSQVLETSSVYATETEDQSPDFFSREGLAMNNGSEVDSQHTLRPNEAHNHLKPYLVDHFVFRGANNVEGFSRIFASVNSRNKAWAFLDTIVRGNALLRIGDVLRFSPVAVSVGAGSSTLSYQKGYFPIIEFLSSDLVLKTTMHQNTNMIYALLDRNYDDFHSTTRECMREMIEAQTWIDRSPRLPTSRQNTLSGVEVFGTLSTVLSQYFARVKSAIKNHPELRDLVEDVFSWFNIWAAAVRASPPTFQDPITSSSPQIRNLTLGELEKDISRLSQIALTSRLEQAYDPPGTLRVGGEPRHDNDSADIRNIRIAPTNEELLCPLPPYLPVFLPSAPHHLPENSMERHLDIQFRLLREELMFGEIRRDLETMWTSRAGLKTRKPPTLLEKLLSSKGGAYKTSGVNSVYFQLYTGARFAPLRAERRNFTVGLTLDSPPGAPRDENGKKRAEYWENSKRLQQGSLVALALISPGRSQVFLGTIVSQASNFFFDAEIELMALRCQPISIDKSTFAVLIDNQIMFEALNPFLRTLKDVEPTSVPFADFISYTGNLAFMPVGPPRYTRVPLFKYDLQCLARPGERISSVDVNNPTAVAIARQQLIRSSNLDPSQVEAVIGTLTREVSLIQGFTAKEILRVLFTSKIRPIVLIAFTNHALDHMVTSVLDAKITTNIVRLGSRTTDERIEQYSLHKLEQLLGRGDLDRPIRREYAAMKQVEEEMTRIMNRIQLPGLTWEDAERFLDFQYPQHADSFRGPPFWISEVFRRIREDEIENGEWKRASKGRKRASRDAEISGVYALWKNGRDIEFIQPPASSSKKAAGKKGADSDPRVVFFNELGFEGQIPRIPSGSRSVEQLTGVYNVWSMSLLERQRLAEVWEDDMRKIAYESLLAEFDQLKEQYKDACKVYEDIQDESVGPKVLMVEEAGQVLEAHILASLVPSALSMESASGRELFKFDRSLMERLSDGGMSMSQINVQRRMRPSIPTSKILYPKLEDNEVVRSYPAVQGMEKNVVFFSHNNAENSEDDSVSKHNMFEVAMIRDLVLYFLKQGPYDGAGDIAVLCAYLGQLQKVRAALKDLKIAVSVDERDEEQLERTGLAVLIMLKIRIGTVDTFQGQEAKIVIISLVRNSGAFEEGNVSIGFLKSSNRINVALSRAKHGLYILGNASNLRKNETWRTVLDEMENEDQICRGFPIVCPRHPEAEQLISKPGQLPTHAPEGGCLRPCEYRLSCGHVCPSMCHTDQDNHRRMKCNRPCVRVTCPRAHPCGNCIFPMYNVKLPCGHIVKSVPWTVKCVAQVLKRLPGCEHSGIMACSGDPTNFECKELCGGDTTCCGRTCKSRCYECQKVTRDNAAPRAGAVPPVRTHHTMPTLCGLACSSDHSCNPKCSLVVSAAVWPSEMPKECWEPCPPCMGHICSRLPCDKACEWRLECGHRCPSIDIVDFIMQRRLDEIDLSSDDISERLIKLECGHIFTVETLDGHCNMSDYYDHKAPPVNFQTPPSCPACRGPITALRYGRNVASTMSSAIEEVGPEIEGFSRKLDSVKGEAKSIAFNPPSEDAGDFDILSARRRTRFGPEFEPLPHEEFSQASMTSVHGLSVEEGRTWNKVVRDLLKLYRKVAHVARTRGPHVQPSDPERASDTPEPVAMIEVNKKIGQPPHKADTRFQVEAFFLTLELRYTLAEIAQSRIEDEMVLRHERLWRSFVSFVYESCIRDAKKALNIAEKSSASRLAAQAGVNILRGKLELFRFEILAERTLLSRQGLLDTIAETNSAPSTARGEHR
ncbi:AAA domain-containing protein [Lactarius pseudohatsudake]|nr:AAA domain-containing protein [Lactarius pseudohatsudake]